jgi:hypothetical protein
MMTPVVCVDFSSGRGDGCVWARVCWAHQDDVPEVLSERRYLPRQGGRWLTAGPAPSLAVLAREFAGDFWEGYGAERVVGVGVWGVVVIVAR